MIFPRLEGSTLAPGIQRGLANRMADPYWTLSRQWQLGEFQGEDAASPVQAKITTTSIKTDWYQPVGDDQPLGKLTKALPLEALVEREPVAPGPAAFRLAAEAGLALLNLLHTRGVTDLHAQFKTDYPLAILPDASPQERRLLRLLARRSCNGARIYARLTALQQELAGNAAASQALTDWAEMYESRFSEPERPSAWQDHKLRYEFNMAAQTNDTSLLVMPAVHTGERLDWYAFNIGDPIQRAGNATIVQQDFHTLPVPVQYAGMPASRLWAFENGSVNFGDVSAGPPDLAHIILAEFGIIYRDDWFHIPLQVPVGSLTRVQNL